jgi:uncharacterized protein (TIGR03067 family)
MAGAALVSIVAPEAEIHAERELLQGTWQSISGRREAEFIIAGYLFAVHFTDGEVYMGAFQLNPRARPKTIDMRIDEGPVHHRGKIAHCIYEVDGDTLRWCAAEPGTEELLSHFPSIYDTRHLSLIFQRQQPRGAKGGTPKVDG